MSYRQKLFGKEKAAAMLLSLPEDIAGQILEKFSESEIQEISKAMLNVGKISSNVLEGMFSEFMKDISTTGVLVGGKEQVNKLLSKALSSDQLNQLMEDMKGPGGKNLWEKLSNVNPQLIAKHLINEHPQTIALILSMLKPEHSSKIFSLFPDSFSIEVMIRMVRMGPVKKEIIEDIEKNLKEKFVTNVDTVSSDDNYELLAWIFNNMDHSSEVRLFSKLLNRHPDIANSVKSFMFDFEDIIDLDDKTLQIILQEIDKSKLAFALKGTTNEFKEVFLKNLSERSARLLVDDMKNLGSVRLSEVEEARSYIVSVAKEIENTGAINLMKKFSNEEKLVE